MYAGYMDEVGSIFRHTEESGFLFFSTIGGTGVATEIGQRVMKQGHDTVLGVIGHKAIQGFKPANSVKRPRRMICGSTSAPPGPPRPKRSSQIGNPVTVNARSAMSGSRLAVGGRSTRTWAC